MESTPSQGTPSRTTPAPAPVSGKPRTWKPITAGILCMVAGVSNIIGGIVFTALGGMFGAMWGIPWIGAIGIPLISIGAISIIGGIFAIRRKLWGLALVGAIFALSSLIHGVLAIIFVTKGKNEFS